MGPKVNPRDRGRSLAQRPSPSPPRHQRGWQNKWPQVILFFSLALLIVLLLNRWSQTHTGGGRTAETVALFLIFLVGCLLLDRWFGRHSFPRPHLTSEAREGQRLRQLCIGIPTGLVHLEALRAEGLLEQRLAPLGIQVSWKDFTAASDLLEALSTRDIDFCGGGGTPSVFAQAADQFFVRVARDKYTNPGGDAILVPEHSHLHSIADLRGARVAVDAGSTAHFVLIAALRQQQLRPDDVTMIFLPQDEARLLFQRQEVDAWAVWIPYADSPIRQARPGRSIATIQTIFGDDPTDRLPTLYYCVPELVRDYPTILKIILEEINEAGTQAKRQELASVERLRDQLNIPAAVIEQLQRRVIERAIIPLDDRSLAGLQEQADILRELRLIPKRINVRDGTYSLIMRQNWTTW